MSIFNKDFYPTPIEVIDRMMLGVDVANKVILEPSAGSGAIVDYLYKHGAKRCNSVRIIYRITKDTKR